MNLKKSNELTEKHMNSISGGSKKDVKEFEKKMKELLGYEANDGDFDNVIKSGDYGEKDNEDDE